MSSRRSWPDAEGPPSSIPFLPGEMIMRRREFLKTAGSLSLASGFPSLVPGSVFGAYAPSNRINVGFIGLGNQSTLDLPAFLRNDDVQVLAVCDVNTGSH